MKLTWLKAYLSIPKEYRNSFYPAILKENSQRILIAAILFFGIELGIYFFGVDCAAGRSKTYISLFLASNLILIPLLWYGKRKIGRLPVGYIRAIHFFYLVSVLALSIALSFLYSGAANYGFIYIAAIFCITSFIYMTSLECVFVLAFGYLLVVAALAISGLTTEEIIVIHTNILIFNLFAWVQNRMILRLNFKSFQNGRLLQKKNEALEEMVRQDTMTGLLNHAASYKQLSAEIQLAKATGAPLSLLFLDIDDLKKINDRYGHLTGDRVIRGIAENLKEAIGEQGIIGRCGGDEFIVILPGIDLEDAIAAAARLMAAKDELEKEIGIKTTVSGGISQYSDETLEELVRITDGKLYAAKNAGKGRIEC